MLDTIIIGAGPAGLTALLYAVMYKMTAVCVGDKIGGKLILAPNIFDYPGIEAIIGKDFTAQLVNQIRKINASVEEVEVASLKFMEVDDGKKFFEIKTISGKMFSGRTVILATGNGKKQAGDRLAKFTQGLNLIIKNKLLEVDAQMATNVPGVFAAGDCVMYPNSYEQLATAVAMGIRAAGGVYNFLNGKFPPILWGEAQIQRII